MKRCPTCRSIYTNDALRFCLQDGAELLSASDAGSAGDDSPSERNGVAGEETLQLSGASPSTGIVDPRATPTVKTPAAPPTALESPNFGERSEPEADARTASPRSTHGALIAGVTAIAVLLLVLIGIGIALLLRGRSDEGGNAQAQMNRNANLHGGNHNADYAENSDTQGRARRPDMTGEFSPAAARVEAKILRGASVSQSDITGLSRAELRRLRNTVYARHGRIFERMELQQYFDGRPWYKKRADYSDNDLSPVDRDNINLIRAAEDRST
ncbi:MAG TPA: YARHG domain-containing protein [Pyrinomonadaceae bacterium]